MDKAICTKCGCEKLLDDFARDASKRAGYKSHCKACDNLRCKRWYYGEANAEAKARRREYNAARRKARPPLVLEPRVCETCGETYAPHRNDQRLCGPACRRLRPRAYPIRNCVRCSTEYKAKSRSQLYCRKGCAQRRAYELIGPVTRRETTQSKPIPKTAAPRSWYSCFCLRCSESFLASRPLKFCSPRCSQRHAKDERKKQRVRTKDERERVYRRRIYERDDWRCQLCGRKVKRDAKVPHPLAPTLDHIIPEARGGLHTPTNVQCAHFKCNSEKGHRGHARHKADQLRLLG